MQETMTLKKISATFDFGRWMANAIVLLAIVFFVHYALHNFDKIPYFKWGPWAIVIALISVALATSSIGIVGAIWYMLLRENAVSTSWKNVQIIFFIAQFGKYLPGNVGHHIGRVVMARAIGIPVPITLNTMLVEVLWGTSIAAGLSMISLLLFVDGQLLGLQFKIGPLQLFFGVVLLFILPWMGIRFLNRYLPGLANRLSGGSAIAAPKMSTALTVSVLFLLCFVLMGLILKLQAQWLFGVSEGSVFELTCLFAIIWLAGYLVPGAPAGLGVREAMMVLLLTPMFGAGVAVGLGVTLRVTTTVGDAVAFALGILARKLST
jgi:hypothetical protein